MEVITKIISIYDETKKGFALSYSEINKTVSQSNKKKIMVLDFHNVADISNFLDQDLKSKFSEYFIIILSFVGKNGQIRINTSAKISQLVTDNKIDLGILVFSRGKKDTANTFIDFGGKAHVINKLCSIENISKIIFVDDGADHIKSTNYILDPNNKHTTSMKNNIIKITLKLVSVLLYEFPFDENKPNLNNLNTILENMI